MRREAALQSSCNHRQDQQRPDYRKLIFRFHIRNAHTGAKERHQDRQKAIFYITADTPQAALASPHLEVFRRKNVEVLLLTDRVDEWMASFLREFEGRELVSVAKGDLDLGDLADAQEKEAQEKVADEYKDVVGAVKAALGDRVKDVRVTLRLTDSPACIVVDRDEMSQHLQRLLKAAGQSAPESKPVLEINPDHPLVRRLRDDPTLRERAEDLGA